MTAHEPGSARPRITSAIALAALFAAQLVALEALGQTSLRAELELLDPASGRAVTPNDGEPVRLRVNLTDAVTDRPPRGLDLLGWVRPVERGNVSCARAAQAFRATRRIPIGSADLNGILLAVLNQDDSLGVIDPKLDLYSSNMLAAKRFAETPAAITVDRAHMRALLSFPDAGEVRSVALMTGETSVFAAGLEAPSGLAAVSTGALWLVEAGEDSRLSFLDGHGRMIESFDVGGGQVQLRKAPDSEDDRIGAFSDGGGVFLADGVTGRVLLDIDLGRPLADVTFIGDQAILALIADQPIAELRYVDAPERAIDMPIALPFARVASGPDARMAIAYSPGSPTFAVIDTALGRVVQPVQLSDASVSEVAFTDNAAFLLSHDGGFVGAIDLATVALGKPAVIREVNLGARSALPEPGSELLVPLFPSPQILAVEPANQTGWIIGEVASSVEMPPMNSTRLRGGVPSLVRVVDRSFRETAPGSFETVWAFPAGEHELVLTTGIGGLSTCVPFAVRGIVQSAGRVAVTMKIELRTDRLIAGEAEEFRVTFLDPDGKRLPFERMDFLVPSLRSGWRTTLSASRAADGSLLARLTLPHAGSFVLQPLGLPEHMALRSAVVIDALPKGDVR